MQTDRVASLTLWFDTARVATNNRRRMTLIGTSRRRLDSESELGMVESQCWTAGEWLQESCSERWGRVHAQ